MRLWHTELLPVLPRQQLLGQWRELNSIFKLQNRHILINFVYDYPKEHLQVYAFLVCLEMIRRKYKFNLKNYNLYFKNIPRARLYPFPEKMTDRYLLQCYYNLQEKYDCGAITAEEWEKIEKFMKEKIYEK